jgi:hypothetical protein
MARRAVGIVFLVTMALGVAPLTRGAADGSPGAAPKLRAEQASLDLGDVVAGSEVRAHFVLHNDGDRDVRIIRAKPS